MQAVEDSFPLAKRLRVGKVMSECREIQTRLRVGIVTVNARRLDQRRDSRLE